MSPGTPPRLVGRDVELELLVGLLESVRRGSARCAVIEGEAGIGKTALLGGLIEAATRSTISQIRLVSSASTGTVWCARRRAERSRCPCGRRGGVVSSPTDR
jgi:hypothetical protein